MVQYILTPWRNRRELLLVRRQFYGASPYSDTRRQSDEEGAAEDGRHDAVARVGMWIQRGNCPHMVESTMLLTAAVLSDEREGKSASEGFTTRGAYAMAFSRFVTGLLDSQQDKQRKQSMYSLAKTIGLPATFVELRHESTHEALPSTAKLRRGAKKALKWIWESYWRHLGEDVEDEKGVNETKETEEGDGMDEDAPAAQADDDTGGTSSTGWTLDEGPWKPKPIGVV